MKSVSALMVAYKAVDYVEMTVTSFRKFYPDMDFLIINGSPVEDPCTDYINNLFGEDRYLRAIHLGKNHSHGLSLNQGMFNIDSEYVYIFDSDVEMLKPGMVEAMLELMDPDTYGCGFINYTSRGGGGTKTQEHGDVRGSDEIRYLHPFACLVSMDQYNKFPPFNFYGAPFIDVCNAIEDTGRSEDMIKYFPVKKYVKHYSGGTRARYGDWPGNMRTTALDKIEKELKNEYSDIP